MPSAKELQHRRTHNLLLVSKLLGGRENASPFTLVLDSLEQSGKPLVREMMRRASASKANVVFVSFETLRKPANVENFIHAFDLSPVELQKRLNNYTTSSTRTLLIFDTLHPLLSNPITPISSFLSSLMSPTTSIVAVYHTDIPVPAQTSSYSPHPLTLLKYLATTLFTTHSLHHMLVQKAARDKSHPEPLFGLAEEIEGVIQGLGSNDPRGIVVEMEYRRKSGRGVGEWFFLPSPESALTTPTQRSGERKTAHVPGKDASGIILLEDHVLYSRPVEEVDEEGLDSTFDLGLTEKQRRDREGVVLPYFDAQESGGGGEGGRILYDMGVEDDFDEEEDEI